MASIQKRTKKGLFYAYYRDEYGRRTCKCTESAKRSEAMQIALDYERAADAARRGTLTVEKARAVLNGMLSLTGQSIDQQSAQDFATRWLSGKEKLKASRTAERYSPIIKRFMTAVGPKAKSPLSNVTPQDIEVYRDSLITAGKSPGSVRLELKIVGALFNHGRRQGVIQSNPVAAVEIDGAAGAVKEPFTPAEVGDLLHAAGEDSDWYGTILIAALTGLRMRDTANLRWSAVDLTTGKETVSITPKKTERTGKKLLLPLHPGIVDCLVRRQSVDDPKAYLFPSLAGSPGGRGGLSGMFTRLMNKAGIERTLSEAKGKGRRVSNKSFHSLRHYTSTELLNAGVDESLRMKLAGHGTAAMNRRYSHATVESLRGAVGKLKTPERKK